MTRQKAQSFAKELDPSARIIVKEESWLMQTVAVLVWLFNRRFMTDYATTICNRVYIPRSWFERDLRRLIVHEVAGHVRQCRRCGLGMNPWVGFPLYAILYLLLPFPIMLAYFRYRFELGASVEEWRWSMRSGEAPDVTWIRALRFGKTVASWDYLKPWPASLIKRGFYAQFDAVVAELGKRHNV